MKLLDVLFPIITDHHEQTVDFYKALTLSEPSQELTKDPYHMTQIGKFVIISPSTKENPLANERKVDFIFVVDDVGAYWIWVQSKNAEVLVPIENSATGRRFLIIQKNGKAVEYLTSY